MTKKTYSVAVKVSDKKNAGTDDKLYIVIFGPEGSTEKIRLDNKDVDDYKRNKTSTFVFSTTQYEIGDQGIPYAIGLMQSGSDAIHIEKVTVSYWDSKGVLTNCNFPFNGAMGDKGDFGPTAKRKEVTLYRDDYIGSAKTNTISEKLQELWFVLDNRNSTKKSEETYSTTISGSTGLIFEQNNTNTVTVAAKYSSSSGGFLAQISVPLNHNT